MLEFLDTESDLDATPVGYFDDTHQRHTRSSQPFDRRRYFSISDGIAAEIVEALNYETFAFRFCAPLHTLVVHEQGARNCGETLVEGAPRSTLRNFARKLSFVPAYHEYGEWQEPRTLARLMYVYFDPVKLSHLFDPAITGVPLPAKLFFEDARLLDTALMLKRSLENGIWAHRRYVEALGRLLEQELVRFNGGENWLARHRSRQTRH